MSDVEIIDVLDDDGKVIDTIPREQAEKLNHLTENVLIFLFNSKGEVWAQLRPMNKNHYPGKWDISACGGIVSGEDRDLAAQRETKEETGLEAKLSYAETFLNIFEGDSGEERKRLSHLYVGFSDKIPQPTEEVDEFRAWDPEKLRNDIKANPDKYVPPFLTELEMAVEARQKLK